MQEIIIIEIKDLSLDEIVEIATEKYFNSKSSPIFMLIGNKKEVNRLDKDIASKLESYYSIGACDKVPSKEFKSFIWINGLEFKIKEI